MAWLDERVWCHPKFTDLSGNAGWTWTRGVAYASGMGTGGVLTPGQQRMVGADRRIRAELVTAGLWDEMPDGGVEIHDWDEHNGKRDARRAAERERMREKRANSTANNDANGAANRGVLTGEGSEGSDSKPKAVTERPQDHTKLRSVS